MANVDFGNWQPEFDHGTIEVRLACMDCHEQGTVIEGEHEVSCPTCQGSLVMVERVPLRALIKVLERRMECRLDRLMARIHLR